MRKTSDSIFRIMLIFGDILSIMASFFFAYYIRTNVDTRPYFFNEQPVDFLTTIIFLAPFWVIILAALGLYRKSIIFNRSHSSEVVRLFLASVLGTMSIITIGYFKNENIFTVRTVAFYSTILCFFFLILFRAIFRFIRILSLRHGRRITLRAVIIGNNKNTTYLSEYISKSPESGYSIAGIVSAKKYLPKGTKVKQYSSLKDALRHSRPDVIFQTDERQTEYVYKQSLNHHIPYYFVPSEAALSSQLGELELVGNTPAILVKVTPLAGFAGFVKRFFDIIFSLIIFIVAFIPMLLIFIIIKLSDPKHKALYSEYRLTRYNRSFKIFKFRSMKPEYSGMSPEDAFKKMGHPELIKKYRNNGDYLENDPRITKIGKFIRRTSLDELPQLINIIKGDISLVGPRALVPGELRNYGDRSLLLSVKSGLTGLAQVSGRRDIPFDERRQLDIYYIQNWSLLLDIQILLKTFRAVFKREGAK